MSFNASFRIVKLSFLGAFCMTSLYFKDFTSASWKGTNATSHMGVVSRIFFYLSLSVGLLCGVSGSALATYSTPVSAQVALLPDNAESWYARWKLISEARTEVDIAVFALENDVFGRALLGLLLKKAEQGVRVRLLLDSKGSEFFASLGKGYLETLVESRQVEIRLHNPVGRSLLRAIFGLKNVIAALHYKSLVVDGQWALTGGRNIGKDYFADPITHEDSWRDTDVVFRGEKLTTEFLESFEEQWEMERNISVSRAWFDDWFKKKEELLFAAEAMDAWIKGQGAIPQSVEMQEWLRSEELRKLHEGDGAGGQQESPKPVAPDMFNDELSEHKMMVEYSRFDFRWEPSISEVSLFSKGSYVSTISNDITERLIGWIDASEKEIILQNPYVVLSRRLFKALKRAHDRGVQIILHTTTPISSDSVTTQAFFIHDWSKLRKLLPRAKVFAFCEERKLHSKVFVFDRKRVVIGSYNLDALSESINSELVAVIETDAFAEATVKMLQSDLDVSVELTAPTEEPDFPSSIATIWSRFWMGLINSMWFLRAWV